MLAQNGQNSRDKWIFTSGSINPEGSTRRTTKKQKGIQRRKEKRNQCLLVLANKFENANLEKCMLII